MNAYELPTNLNAGGQTLHVRRDGDWRVVLDAISAMTDPELRPQERMAAALMIFYDVPLPDIRDAEAAMREMMQFVAAGEEPENGASRPAVVDWEEDALLIVSGVNRVLGREVRADAYLHWWTFVAAYMAIGDGPLATVVGIRDKVQRGKKLEKYEQDYKRDNPQYFRPRKRDGEKSKALMDELWGGD